MMCPTQYWLAQWSGHEILPTPLNLMRNSDYAACRTAPVTWAKNLLGWIVVGFFMFWVCALLLIWMLYAEETMDE